MDTIKSILSAPNAPRALLVSLSRDGQLNHQPVARGASVLDIETNLMDHLTDFPCSDAFLEQLRQYCESRLEARRQARVSGGFVYPQPGNVWTIMHMPTSESQKMLED